MLVSHSFSQCVCLSVMLVSQSVIQSVSVYVCLSCLSVSQSFSHLFGHLELISQVTEYLGQSSQENLKVKRKSGPCKLPE